MWNEAASRKHAKSVTAVWWDIDTCPVPDGYDARRAVQSIECALKDLGYKGPLTITAIGNMAKNLRVLRELCSAGIKVEHCVPDRTYIEIFCKYSLWEDDNPPPATMMFISDTVKSELAEGLCKEQQQVRGYNLLLGFSSRDQEPSILHTTASWVWKDLLSEGETKGHVCSSEFGESSSVVLCTSCEITLQSFEEFVKHLSTEKHALEENKLIEPPEESKPPKSKRRRKASRTDCRLLPYHLAKRKRSRKAFRKDCRLLQDHLGLIQNHLGRLHDKLGRFLTKRRD